MPSSIYEIFNGGRKIGITVAANATLARESAYGATTRRTDSKMDVACDYEGIVTRKLEGNAIPMGNMLRG